MNKILAAICVMALAITLSATQVMAERRHHYGRPHYDRHHYDRQNYERNRDNRRHRHKNNAGPIIGGILGGLVVGSIGTAIILDANRAPRTIFAPAYRRALMQCNRCGYVDAWQGVGNPPPPRCGCPSSYRWEWQ